MNRRKPKKRTPNRTRTRPIQVYVTDAEYMLLVKLAGRKRISELIRGWIGASGAARGFVADARQLSSV